MFIKQGISTSLGPVEVKTGEKNTKDENKTTNPPTPAAPTK